jgi:tRNA nucleotidyltransferase (CCA-adding enzyme)
MLAGVVSPTRSGDDAVVRPPDPQEMLDRVRALPTGEPLLRRLSDQPGVFLVGGAVRDLLLGGQPSDLDLVVEDDPVETASRLGEEVTVHDRFGTSTVNVGGFSYDVARARRETYPRPGALPEVAPASLDEDLGRRDFTVNAIALELGGPRAGQLRAVPGGLEDLERHALRVLHDQSFIDDPTRLLRLARYRGRLAFGVEPHTRELVAAALASGALGTVSGSRIGRELRLLAAELDPVAAMLALRELGIDRALDPRFGLDEQELAHRAFALLPADGSRAALAVALAGRRMPPVDLRRLLERLSFPASERDVVLAAAAGAPALVERLAAAVRPSEIAAAAAGAGPEQVVLAGALGAERQAREWLDSLRGVQLEIDGSDLLAYGVAEGPAVGRGMRAALAAKLDGQARGREQELAAALEAARGSG